MTTFAGALEGQPVEKAIPRYKEVFGELARRAEAKGVRLAIENCPMDGTWHKATCNIGFNPKAWEMMFDAVPSRAIGLEWEPAHQMVQLIDPLPQLEEWADRVYHIHGKGRHPPLGQGAQVGRLWRWGVRGIPDAGLRRHRLAGRVPHPLFPGLCGRPGGGGLPRPHL